MTTSQASKRRLGARQWLQFGLGTGLAVALVVWGLPAVGQTTWSQVWREIQQLSISHALGYQLLMLLGLYCYTFTFTGSLPGLKHNQALVVNLCGSSVSNLLPAGGAAGLAATVTILRSWGFSGAAVSTSAIITGVWNVVARLAIPLVGIIALYIGNTGVPPAVQGAAFIAGGIIAFFLVIFVAFFASNSIADHVARWTGAVIDPLVGKMRRGNRPDAGGAIMRQRERMMAVVRKGWPGLTFGMIGFFGIYFVLFLLLARDLGMELPVGKLFAAYAVGRLLTAVGITPGGMGVTEAGTLATLVSYGASNDAATALVVLFSIFTQIMEVPLGALGWGLWALSPKKRAVDESPLEAIESTLAK